MLGLVSIFNISKVINETVNSTLVCGVFTLYVLRESSLLVSKDVCMHSANNL